MLPKNDDPHLWYVKITTYFAMDRFAARWLAATCVEQVGWCQCSALSEADILPQFSVQLCPQSTLLYFETARLILSVCHFMSLITSCKWCHKKGPTCLRYSMAFTDASTSGSFCYLFIFRKILPLYLPWPWTPLSECRKFHCSRCKARVSCRAGV